MTPERIAQLRQDHLIETTLHGHVLHFLTTWGTFSSKEIDAGTKMLLEHMDVPENSCCFDLGCGYGPIGITLAKLAPQGKVLMADRDYIAVEYANQNAAKNNVNNAKAILSNGFSNVEDGVQFDIVVSNIPAKVGNEMLTLFLHDAHRHLKSGGRFYVVTINGLRDYFKRTMKTQFGHYKKIKQGRDYTVAYAEKS